jgi:hypothetical protein
LGDLIKTFTGIRALKVMNVCQIITIYLNDNKTFGQKTVVTMEPETGSNMYMPGFTVISNHKVRNLCKILIAYLIANKCYGQKTYGHHNL